MRPTYASPPSGRRRNWKKVIGGAAALSLFLPLPALALTFLGSWRVTQQRTGGAPRATVTAQDTSTGGILNIDLGSFASRTAGSLTVTATRDFRVDSAGEAVTIARNIQTILKNASVDASVQIQNVKYPTFSESAGSRPRFFQDSTVRTKHLRGGTYRVVITVRNSKTANGSWNTVSPYQFTFSGVRGPSPGDLENNFLTHYRAPGNPFTFDAE